MAAFFERTCYVCKLKLDNYDQYFYHYHDFHPLEMIDMEMKKHYADQVSTEYFKDKDAQPWEWLIGEPVIFKELQIMFGEHDPCCKLWGADALREEDDRAANGINEERIPESMLDALQRLRTTNFYIPYNRKRLPSPTPTQ